MHHEIGEMSMCTSEFIVSKVPLKLNLGRPTIKNL